MPTNKQVSYAKSINLVLFLEEAGILNDKLVKNILYLAVTERPFTQRRPNPSLKGLCTVSALRYLAPAKFRKDCGLVLLRTRHGVWAQPGARACPWCTRGESSSTLAPQGAMCWIPGAHRGQPRTRGFLRMLFLVFSL